MRRLWTQAEVVAMGQLLGFRNFDRRSLRYWTNEAKIFPKPVASAKGMISFYKDSEVEAGLLDIARRIKTPTTITQADIEWVKDEVLKTVKAKNVDMLLKKIREQD